jgi:phosphoribosylaminoimidazolecarboxamide formyltransferase/IMP cyclohydrolase
VKALLSVYDKTGVLDVARQLAELGCELISTGGTAATLRDGGLIVTEVSELTGFPEILDGRVKTLHPVIHAGLLARRDVEEHMAQLERHGIAPVDVVISNLYPFLETLGDPSASHEDVVEKIDVGGPAMLRAASKNYRDVLVLVDPADYPDAIGALKAGRVGEAYRRALAAKAFQHVAAYDTHVAGYLRGTDPELPDVLTFAMKKQRDLRYGENPHQRGALYLQTPALYERATVAGGRQLGGPELSFLNVNDIDAALRAARDFAAPCCAIVKHATPCGLACAESLEDAYRRALAADPMAAYGGAVAVNRPMDLATAKAIAEHFFHDVVAPGYLPGTVTVLQKKRSLRILEVDLAPLPPLVDTLAPTAHLDLWRVSGGFLVQTPDRLLEDDISLKTVSDREPTLDEVTDMLFGWRAVKHVLSNAIVLSSGLAVVGVGGGQVSRVDSVETAVHKAGPRAIGSVMASDAMFPFPDGVEVAARAGVTAVIQPGGSIRDEEIIREVNRHHMAMVFTGVRHFRH